jgi:hypothetical protein
MSNLDIVKIIHVDENTCLESYPCQHYVQVQRKNGTVTTILMSAPTLVKACDKFGYQLINKSHFNYVQNLPDFNKLDIKSKINLDSPFVNTCVNGKYYNPANLHYSQLSPNSQVKCDRCNKTINVCIGLGNIDLCLICTDQLNKKIL